MERSCWICESSMIKFENQVVMFDDIPIVCSGWTCKACGEVVLDEADVDRVLNELREAREKQGY